MSLKILKLKGVLLILQFSPNPHTPQISQHPPLDHLFDARYRVLYNYAGILGHCLALIGHPPPRHISILYQCLLHKKHNLLIRLVFSQFFIVLFDSLKH